VSRLAQPANDRERVVAVGAIAGLWCGVVHGVER
jgi:hypothetical protein